ncbi:MAG: hypothetical protein M3Q32_07955 [Pseudomonadota bacterium]|nr:hypothetical protein [Pseudomonadota bacterium]
MSNDKKGPAAPITPASDRISKAPDPIMPLSSSGHTSQSDRQEAFERPADWSKWRFMLKVKLYEAVALSLNLEPQPPPLQNPAFKNRLVIAGSHLSIDGLLRPEDYSTAEILLPEFGVWAESIDLELPAEFPRRATEDKKPKTVTTAETDSTAKPLGTNERNTLLKIIIGMATKGYCYDATASRNDAIGEKCKDLESLGIGVTDDTVRGKLREAAVLLRKKSK